MECSRSHVAVAIASKPEPSLNSPVAKAISVSPRVSGKEWGVWSRTSCRLWDLRKAHEATLLFLSLLVCEMGNMIVPATWGCCEEERSQDTESPWIRARPKEGTKNISHWYSYARGLNTNEEKERVTKTDTSGTAEKLLRPLLRLKFTFVRWIIDNEGEYLARNLLCSALRKMSP